MDARHGRSGSKDTVIHVYKDSESFRMSESFECGIFTTLLCTSACTKLR